MDAERLAAHRRAGEVAARARELGASLVKPGARCLDVAEAVERYVREQGCAFAAPCCLSIDDEAAHWTPGVGDARTFREGDLVKVDVSVQLDGWIADNSMTVECGGTDRHGALREAALAALEAGVAAARPGAPVLDVSRAIEESVRASGVRAIVNLAGHSIERHQLHAGLSVPPVAAAATGTLEPGLALAIEPFVTPPQGAGQVKDGAGGHIYRLLAAKPQRDPHARAALDLIRKRYDRLPFAERWIAEAVPEARVPYAMKLLERSGAVMQYAVLREATGAPVAQFEHTLLVLDDRIEVTTR